MKQKNIYGSGYNGWTDKFNLGSKNLYSYVFIVHSMQCYNEIAKDLGFDSISLPYKYYKLELINIFWNGDYLTAYASSNLIDVGANMLAIFFGLVDDREARLIFKSIKILNQKKMYISNILPENGVGKKWFGNSANDYVWIWVQCLYELCHQRIFNEKTNILEKIEYITFNYNTLYDRVTFNNEPIKQEKQNPSSKCWTSG